VSIKKGRDAPETLKTGTPLEHAHKQNNEVKRMEQRVVGLNIGATLNMGDYESLRIDCWLSDTVKPGESIEDAYERIGAIVNEQLAIQKNQMLE
jgi:hypothetical protein